MSCAAGLSCERWRWRGPLGLRKPQGCKVWVGDVVPCIVLRVGSPRMTAGDVATLRRWGVVWAGPVVLDVQRV